MLEFLTTLLVAFALVFGLVSPVVAAPFYVGSKSGLRPQGVDRVLVNKLAYDFTEPECGHIVLFHDIERRTG